MTIAIRTEAPPALLTSALERGEKLSWWDRPQGGIVFRAMDAFAIPFSIVWTSIAGAGAVAILRSGEISPQALMSVVFLAVGAYLVVGRFFYDAWRRGRTVYGLTDRRVLILQPSRQVSLALDGIAEMSLQERRNGRGSIAFGPSAAVGRARQSAISGEPAIPTFEFIPEVHRVHAAIREAQKKLRRD
jgi:hypothetical protein